MVEALSYIAFHGCWRTKVEESLIEKFVLTKLHMLTVVQMGFKKEPKHCGLHQFNREISNADRKSICYLL